MIPKMPDEYKGEYREAKHKDFILKSRTWTKEEEEWAWNLYKEGYKNREIATSLDRDITCVSIKMKRLKKKYNEYNDKHREDKYKHNLDFLELFNKDVTILDVFCGVNKFYTANGYKNVVTNDKDTKIEADYNMDAEKFLKIIVKENRKFDIVDLDPFGQSITYLEDALKIAEKGLIMTLGELGHKRWKRLDFISKYYDNIQTVEDITIENMIYFIIQKALKIGVKLQVFTYRDWNNIGRVWFVIC